MGRRLLEAAGVLLGIAAFIVLADALTGETSPIWDGRRYRDLAVDGYAGKLVAPFCYRPAMPFLARWLALGSELPIDECFRLLGRVFMGLTLVLVYIGARSFGRAGVAVSGFIALCTALAYYHVRFPLFFWSMVDVAAYPLMLLAFHLIWRGKVGRAGLLAAVGLTFKEFLLVPWLVAIVQGYLVAWRTRRPKGAVLATAALMLGATLFAFPRVTLEVARSGQWVDPFNDPEALQKLVEVATDAEHLLAVLTAILLYWAPTLLLMTRARWSAMRAALSGYRRPLLLYLALLFPLILFGGKNVDIFASYALAAQLPVLAGMLRANGERLRPYEALLVVACLLFTNQWFEAIPDPKAQRDAYMAFHGFGGTAISAARLVELAAWLAGANVVRTAARRLRPRAPVS